LDNPVLLIKKKCKLAISALKDKSYNVLLIDIQLFIFVF